MKSLAFLINYQRAGNAFRKIKDQRPNGFDERFLISPIAEYARLYPDVVVDVEFNDKRVTWWKKDLI